LPSPDEPPPPLPSLLNVNAPPPPPPRPKSSTSSSSPLPSSSPHISHHSRNSSNFSVDSTASEQIDNRDSITDLSNKKQITKNNNNNNYETNGSRIKSPDTFSSPFDLDPFCVPINSSSAKKQSPSLKSAKLSSSNSQSPNRKLFNKEKAFISPSSSSSLSNNDSLFSQKDVFSPEFSKESDSFASSSSNQQLSEDSSTAEPKADDKDPFGLPLHLTPGFKATAKFGSDPFEDSFNGNLASSGENWDPFGSHMPVKDPFKEDPFANDPFVSEVPEKDPFSSEDPFSAKDPFSSLTK